MKKKIIVLALIVMAVSILAAGSAAFFTAETTAHNVITSGGVDIKLIETAKTDDGEKDFEDVDGVMPSEEVSKIVKVENTGKSEAWVRIKVDVAVKSGETDGPELNTEAVTMNFDLDKWTDGGDGYYYYNSKLAAGATTEPLFTTVTFDKDMGDEYQNATFTIDVTAYAVQTANNGETAAEAAGWPSET